MNRAQIARAERLAQRTGSRFARTWRTACPAIGETAPAPRIGHNRGPALRALMRPDEIRAKLAGYANQDRLRVILAAPYFNEGGACFGEILEGAYMTAAGMGFVLVRRPECRLGEMAAGDLAELPVIEIERLETRDQVLADRAARARGEILVTTRPTTPEGFRAMLDQLADAIASAPSPARARQLRQQFDDLADMIELAQEKRCWLIGEAVRRREGLPPTPDDGTRTSDARPCPLDFEPDQRRRRDRVARQAWRMADPVYAEIALLLPRLRAAGLDAVRPANAAYIRVRFPMAKGRRSAEFYYRPADKLRPAQLRAECGDSRASEDRVRKAKKTAGYVLLVQLLDERAAELQQRQAKPAPASPGAYRRPLQLGLFDDL